MNFYNLGGGGGMGFDLEHQTLPFDNLQLSEKEIKALVAFTKTLTDTDIKS
jgi:cytochrome c peroxidase